VAENDVMDLDDLLDDMIAEEADADPCVPDVVVADDRVGWFSIVVLTVPDLERFPIPKQFAALRAPVDLSGLDELSGAEVRRLIMPSLPDEQLDEIEARERARVKPRGKFVLDAIEAERATRFDGFPHWVETTARNPLMCRIAALAYQCDGGELMSVAPATLEEESAALEQLRAAVPDWYTSACSLNFRFAGWDIDQSMRVLAGRFAFLCLDLPRMLRLSHLGVDGRDWRATVDQAGGLRVAASALGIAHHEIPEIATQMDVWRVWLSQPGDVRLADWAAGQCQLERDLLQITDRLWA
jgi:hypothetical protein